MCRNVLLRIAMCRSVFQSVALFLPWPFVCRTSCSLFLTILKNWGRITCCRFVACVIWHIHTCDMKHLHGWPWGLETTSHVAHFWHVWHDSFRCVTWRIHACDTYVWHVWHDSCISVAYDVFKCVIWLIHVCEMTHAYASNDICVPWLIHACDMSGSNVWHDSFICVAWLIYRCGMTHSYVWHDSLTCFIWLIYMCYTTRSYFLFLSVTWLVTYWQEMWLDNTGHDSSTCDMTRLDVDIIHSCPDVTRDCV